MGKVFVLDNPEARAAITNLFETAPPILVEVRFPLMATSPDWYLCEEEEQLDQILDRVASGAEVHVHSVWDLKNVKGDFCLRK